MSWSVSAIGKSQAVNALLADQFGRISCSEPEQTIKNDVATAIARALSYFDENAVVKVSASGSQSAVVHGGCVKEGVFINSLALLIEPQWGFVE
jgi:hypothetical protein